MDFDYVKMGAIIREARERAKINQAELAEQIGCSSSFLGKVERGERKPTLDVVCKVCYVTGFSLDELVERSAIRPECRH